MEYYAGIDSGSTYIKMAVLDQDKKLVTYRIAPTGINGKKTVNEVRESICSELNIDLSGINGTVATGYGRRMIENITGNVTEIKAHASGARWNGIGGKNIRTVIDIGGQDCKVINLDESGEIENFVMNDKCAAGTGRFLEALARVLEMDISNLGPLSLESSNPCSINSTCVVFAESEVISLLARGEDIRDIIAGIHASMAGRISRMAGKSGIEPEILLTGGGGMNPGLRSAFEEEFIQDIHVSEFPQLNGAIGAAIIAMRNNGF